MMKLAAILSLFLLSATACGKKQETFTCQCYGGFTGGATEQIEIKSTDRANAEQQCKAQAEPPTNVRNSCSLL